MFSRSLFVSSLALAMVLPVVLGVDLSGPLDGDCANRYCTLAAYTGAAVAEYLNIINLAGFQEPDFVYFRASSFRGDVSAGEATQADFGIAMNTGTLTQVTLPGEEFFKIVEQAVRARGQNFPTLGGPENSNSVQCIFDDTPGENLAIKSLSMHSDGLVSELGLGSTRDYVIVTDSITANTFPTGFPRVNSAVPVIEACSEAFSEYDTSLLLPNMIPFADFIEDEFHCKCTLQEFENCPVPVVQSESTNTCSGKSCFGNICEATGAGVCGFMQTNAFSPLGESQGASFPCEIASSIAVLPVWSQWSLN